MAAPIRVAVIAAAEFAYGREMAVGFSAAAALRGWLVEMVPAGRGVTNALRSWDPQVIILGVADAWADIPEPMRSRIIIGAECDRPDLPQVPQIKVDDVTVGRLAAEHFALSGLRTVASLGYRRLRFAMQRTDAFAATAEARGMRYLGYWDQLPPTRDAHGRPAFEPLRAWLAAASRPVGLFCGCDNWGRAALTGLRAVDVRIPEDVAVLGVDNDEALCELVHPPMSSVEVPWDHMGAVAADLAERALRREPMPTGPVLILPTGVVARRSTDVLAVEDADVAAALAFIRDHATRGPLRIGDVLRAVPIGRHRLHRAFRRELGRTVMQEVRRVRLEHARRLLLVRGLSLDQIAARSGFPSYRKLTLAFRAETGETPSAYRRHFH